jgi:hypothetical protein
VLATRSLARRLWWPAWPATLCTGYDGSHSTKIGVGCRSLMDPASTGRPPWLAAETTTTLVAAPIDVTTRVRPHAASLATVALRKGCAPVLRNAMAAPPPGVARMRYRCGVCRPCWRICQVPAPPHLLRAGRIIAGCPSIPAKRLKRNLRRQPASDRGSSKRWDGAGRDMAGAHHSRRPRCKGASPSLATACGCVQRGYRLGALTMHLSAPPAGCCQVRERFQAPTLALHAPEWPVACPP